eukprot:sb/3476212/
MRYIEEEVFEIEAICSREMEVELQKRTNVELSQMVKEKNCPRWWRRRSVPDGGGEEVSQMVEEKNCSRWWRSRIAPDGGGVEVSQMVEETICSRCWGRKNCSKIVYSRYSARRTTLKYS